MRVIKDSPINWAAGDQAICISNGLWVSLDGDGTAGPKQGDIDTVTDVDVWQGAQFLMFANRSGHYFAAWCFDKPQRKSTGIEVLRSLLTPKTPVRETEDA